MSCYCIAAFVYIQIKDDYRNECIVSAASRMVLLPAMLWQR